MAYQDITAQSSVSRTARQAADKIGRVFAVIGKSIMISVETNSRLKRVEALQAKSDAELWSIGLKREDIVRHVFQDFYYV